ncbi:hypothetical protein XBI1_1570110 [Xenorhabdus bovienii str. Intermedium]|uniref:Uncharacterized protein n=1 Tax=Xenorhabdus bovienii str. Intermedium TaxID=1379677 RepID=A0A077QH81_XENBV|nr:hypothetical protein XBI1_1570110 [Xenorhabdus bovienii str. Intermedium]
MNKFYLNKQQIALECIGDFIYLHKIVCGWISCEPKIKLKLHLSKIVSWNTV